MVNAYFATYVATAIDEVNKFSEKRFAYGEKQLPNMTKAFKIQEQTSIGDPNADYVCVALEATLQNVKLYFCSPTNPESYKEKTIVGSEFSANPLDSFLKQVFNF
jgi:hypothetical protein